MHKTIVVGLVRSEDSVLLVKQAYGGHFWTLPGGVVETGETLVQAIVREVKEETGLEVHVRGLFGMRDHPSQTCFVFALEIHGGNLVENVPGEIEAVKWFTYEEIVAADPTIEQFPRFILDQVRQASTTTLEMRLWDGFSGPADLFM